MEQQAASEANETSAVSAVSAMSKGRPATPEGTVSVADSGKSTSLVIQYLKARGRAAEAEAEVLELWHQMDQKQRNFAIKTISWVQNRELS
jgi:hypothetical protein